MLSDKNLRAIAVNRENIIDDLMVSDVLSDLRCHKSFTLEDEEIINSKITSKEKASTLIDILSTKNDDLFEHFRDILGSTYEHLANDLTLDVTRSRVRRLSVTEFGEILIKGGVPDRIADYIRRKSKEDEILAQLKIDTKKPILVHGTVGCGKSSIVAYVLHSEEIFPYRYTRVCWMSIGKIQEKDVISKMITLSAKLDPNVIDPTFQIPDLYKERIIEKIKKHNILLILDDIWDLEIMKYFTFPLRYIVTSRQSKLFTDDEAKRIEIPPKFSDDECIQFLERYVSDKDPDFGRKIIEKSHGNPLYLSMIKNLLKSNEDYFKVIDGMSLNDFEINKIIKSNLDILTSEMRHCYEMLAILHEDDAVSLNLLSTYWHVNDSVALAYLNYFCDNHLMTKIWFEEYKCNMYSMHDIHWCYLVSIYEEKIKAFQRLFFDNHASQYNDWLKINHLDPYFFLHCGSILYSLNDDGNLVKLFTDFSFLAAKIVIAGISDILFDFESYRPSYNSALWEEFNHFFMRNSHRFVMLPDTNLAIKIKKVFNTIIQLALFEDQTSKIHEKALSFKNLAVRKDFWVWDNPEPSMKIWESSHIEIIDLMDINHCGIILTSEGKRLSLYEFNSGKCLFNYKILKEKIILCKFLNHDTLEFILLSKSGEVRHFNISNLLSKRTQTPMKEFEDDDDFDSEYDVVDQILTIDFSGLRQKFRQILISDFIKICEETPQLLRKNRIYIAASAADGKIFAASYEGPQSPPGDHGQGTLIECYEYARVILNFDFKVTYRVKKIINRKNTENNEFELYILEENGLCIHLHDDLGDEIDKFSIKNEIINDFIINGNDIYQAAGNNIYVNKEPVPLFSTICEAHIKRISMCHRRKLMALCLTNRSIQIWMVAEKKLLYSLKGFEFTDVYFEYCNTHLITTEQSNVSKWSMDYVNSENELTKSKGRNYRSKFYMYTESLSSVTWIVQKYNNELEIRSYKNEEYKSRFISADSKATCFSIEGEYAFIGFKTSHIQIYNLSDLSCVLTLDTVNNVSQLTTFSIDDHHWNIIVHYNIDKIKIFTVSIFDLTYEESKEISLGHITKLKFFKVCPNKIQIGVSLNDQCFLYNVNEDFTLTKCFHEFFRDDINVIDFDLSDDADMFCAATPIGLLQVWNIPNKLDWKDETELSTVVRKCKIRPKIQSDWNVVATVNDNGEVRLFYFKDNEQRCNIVIEDYPQSGIGIFSTMKWTLDGLFLVFGDDEIKKWNVPLKPTTANSFKHQLTKLYTYAGGIQCINLNECFICTIDQGGFFYIFRKI